MDRAGLADFLRKRRQLLQPEDVGLPHGFRRRTAGLRREEVAALSDMSTDYYARLERQAGPQPSEAMLAAIARALRLSLDERDHLFLLAGHGAPHRVDRTDHVNPGMMRVLDRLHDTPAQVVSRIGETLVQTAPAVALVGDETHYTGFARAVVYRWYTDPGTRERFPAEDHQKTGRAFTAGLRAAVTRDGPMSTAAELAQELLRTSPEFVADWELHEVGVGQIAGQRLRIRHPELGLLDLDLQVLLDPDQSQSLLIFTAPPGSDSHDKLLRLATASA